MGSAAGSQLTAAIKAGVSVAEWRHWLATGMKRCPGCSLVLRVELFGIDKRRHDGRNPWCKKCRNNQHRRYRNIKPNAWCQWCGEKLNPSARADSKFCKAECRRESSRAACKKARKCDVVKIDFQSIKTRRLSHFQGEHP